MSWALVEKGLELLNSNSQTQLSDSKVKASSVKHASSVFKLQKKKSKKGKSKKSFNLSNTNIRTLLDDYEASHSKDKVAQNIRKLKKLDKNLDKDANLEQIKMHQVEALKKNSTTADFIAVNADKETVFTEEDFEKMNDEWLKLL